MKELSGRIIKAMSGFYYVLVGDEIITSRARGNFRNNKINPLVGDFVTIRLEEDSIGYVIKIHDRDNELMRPKVANIDYNIIVTSMKEPDFSSKLLDKIIALNESSDVESIVLFTKIDMLEDKEEYEKIKKYYNSIGYEVFDNSEKEIIKLKEFISRKFVAISGQSGAGKSTFINNLSSGKFNIETAGISKHLGRGKHTTRHVEFYNVDDFYIADTPGFSSIDLNFIEKDDLKHLFIELHTDDCKYSSCNHIDEPKCGIKEKLEDSGHLLDRYNNYKDIYKEIENTKRRY